MSREKKNVVFNVTKKRKYNQGQIKNQKNQFKTVTKRAG